MNPEIIQVFILPIAVVLIFYFFAIRPQNKKAKEIKEMRSGLKVGDKVITIGGLVGTVNKVDEEYITIEIGSLQNQLKVTKWSIGSIIKK